MDKLTIMNRMKDSYEVRARHYLTRRIPVIMRLECKAFHTYTKGLNKPFDEGLIEDMQKTAIYLCEQIQGAKCAYTQSDEISILLTDYENLNTEAWFDYETQEMTSISASLATCIFNKLRIERLFDNKIVNLASPYEPMTKNDIVFTIPTDDWNKFNLANFYSHSFKDDVSNYFLARQLDAEKNSIAMLAQSLYSHKELHGKHGGIMQEMCFQKGHNWNDLHFSKKRGSFIVKNTYMNGELVQETCDYDDVCYPSYTIYAGTNVFKDDGWYDENNAYIDKPIIRTKWEVVETPMRFNESHFKKWL